MTDTSVMNEPAATAIPEAALSRWLFTDPVVCRDLAAELRITHGSVVGFEVATTRLVPDASGPGDIDVLVCPKGSPGRALVIELKRVKIVPETFHTQLPGKLGELKHGVQQANLLHKLGFHRTFLMVAIITDGRERSGLNFASRGPTSALVQLVDGALGYDELLPGVGLAFVELTQPVDKDITWAGAVAVRVVRDAELRTQAPVLTARVTKLFHDEQR